MKNIATLLFCLVAAIVTIVLRSEVYDSTRPNIYEATELQEEQFGHSPVTIHYHNRRPYYVNINGEVHGLVADAVSTVMKYADIEFTWLKTPAKRQLDIIRANATATCAAGWFKTEKRQEFAKFTLPVYQDQPFVAISRKDNELIGDNESLDRLFAESRLRLLVKSGYSYGAYIDDKIEKFKPRQVVTTADNKTMLHMLQTHRAEYCFMTEEEAYDLLLFSGLNKMEFKVVHLYAVPSGNKRYLICSKKVSNATIDQIDASIKHLQNVRD